MRAKLGFASIFTLGVLFSFVFAIGAGVLHYIGYMSAPVLIILVIAFNLAVWLISPTIQDLILSWIYKAQKITPEELATRNESSYQMIMDLCKKHNIRTPKFWIIDDLNPTAYCYGSYPGNSRVAFSTGLLHYLNDKEFNAVIAHEFGHIINKDFIVMTIASTLLQLLYELYVILTRTKGRSSNNSSNSNPLLLIGLVSYVFYIIGTYLVLYLSRTREYLADRFSAEATGDPNALSSALIKIAYGITEHSKSKDENSNSGRLLSSTRAMGIYDYKTADSLTARHKAAFTETSEGAVATMSREESMSIIGIEKVFLFDLYNPWAFVSELSSTHPLTAKRIKAMSDTAIEMGQQQPYNFEATDLYGRAIDKARMYGQFTTELLICALPTIAFIAGLLLMFLNLKYGFGALIALGAGLLIQNLYRFSSGEEFKKLTILQIMCNPYASPIKGMPVEIDGQVIGRTDAGNKYSPHMTIKDESNSIINLRYESIIGFFGNIFFGWKKVEGLIGMRTTIRGWFRRSVSQIIDLKSMKMGDGQDIRSYAQFWAYVPGILIMIAGVALTVLVHTR